MELEYPFDVVAAMEPLAMALVMHHATGEPQEVGFRRDDGIWYEQSTLEYFATPEGLGEIEELIFSNLSGHVLDVGAATGRHCLAMQDAGIRCTAMDVHPALIELMQAQGVTDTVCADFLTLNTGRWDTICFLMDTIGMVGTVKRLGAMLDHARDRLNPGGQILLNAEPVIETEDPSDDPRDDPNETASRFDGELEMQMRYGDLVGDGFEWLYIDAQTLMRICTSSGWAMELLTEHDDTGHYLARLSPLA